MNRIALFAIVALAGALFVLASPAAADDLEECADVGLVEACVVDAQEGHPGNETTQCQDYRGFTGANASHDSDLGDYEAEAGGEETCETNFLGRERRNERVFAEADGDGPAGETDALFEHQARSYGPYDRNETTLRVVHEQADNRTFVRADHREIGDRCRLAASLLVDVEPYRYIVFALGNCPEEASPEAPPNPGWGNVTSLP